MNRIDRASAAPWAGRLVILLWPKPDTQAAIFSGLTFPGSPCYSLVSISIELTFLPENAKGPGRGMESRRPGQGDSQVALRRRGGASPRGGGPASS